MNPAASTGGCVHGAGRRSTAGPQGDPPPPDCCVLHRTSSGLDAPAAVRISTLIDAAFVGRRLREVECTPGWWHRRMG
jgi:hypothetical protein